MIEALIETPTFSILTNQSGRRAPGVMIPAIIKMIIPYGLIVLKLVTNNPIGQRKRAPTSIVTKAPVIGLVSWIFFPANIVDVPKMIAADRAKRISYMPVFN
jgi:hypothetical protein